MASTINWKNINDEITQKAIVAVNSSLNDLKVEIDRNTPIDTAELIQNTVITPATIIGQRVSGTVSNDTPYAVYVEYGVQQKTYNYHKYKQIFFVWVGARMFTRAYDKFAPIITQKIKKALNL